MSRHPLLWFVSLAAVALTVAGAWWWAGGSTRAPSVVPPSASPASSEPFAVPVDAPARSRPAVAVLHAWDGARADAYAAGDVAGLRSLYVDGSAAGTSDVRMLRGYLARGLRVTGMRMQLLAVEVLARAPRRWRLRVTDRLDGAVAVDAAGARTVLPRDRATTRELTLVQRAGSWKVAAVR
ncbi:MAG TPA: hypothetical protein VFG63_00955 [Nocardioidaceae bacterium]|nr:hypothetical protein [Nocardioidaceae bacterium]